MQDSSLFHLPLIILRDVGVFVFAPVLKRVLRASTLRMYDDLVRALTDGGELTLVHHHRHAFDDPFFHVWANFRNGKLTGQLGGTTSNDPQSYQSTVTLRVQGHDCNITVSFHSDIPVRVRFGWGPSLRIPDDYPAPFDALWQRLMAILPVGFWDDPDDVE